MRRGVGGGGGLCPFRIPVMHRGEVYEGSCLTKRRLQTAIFSLSLSLAARCLCPWLLVVSVLGFLSGSPCLCPWLFVRLSLSLPLAACPALIVSEPGCLSGSIVSVPGCLSGSIVSVPGCLIGSHCLCPWLFVRLSLSLSLAVCPAFCRNEALNRSKLLRHTMPDD